MNPIAPNPRPRWQWLWPLVLAALIVLASSRGDVGGPAIPYFDKVVHFGVYGLLATLICRLGQGWRAAAWALLLTSAFGATDEWHQNFVPGRTAETADWIADTLGAAVAVGFYWGCGPYRRWLESSLRRNRRVEKPAPDTPVWKP